ncbi:AGAP000005-PA-like protein [Anopheles sinensis]|uniref:AGAP000005-PA-like protein n=1 Tax=Anopheles sinensis TaxID=74873 RepID=A0A084VAC7_ANOSI|nr:AGAP000005-PA-like protein [Anopheles sinensis]
MAYRDKIRYQRELQKYEEILRGNVPPPMAPPVKRKKQKRAKDPNEPKGPLSAFVWFCRDERKVVKALNPQLTFGGISKELGRQWSQLDFAARQKYQKLAERDRERYEAEMTEYEKKCEQEQGDSSSLNLTQRQLQDLTDMHGQAGPSSGPSVLYPQVVLQEMTGFTVQYAALPEQAGTSGSYLQQPEVQYVPQQKEPDVQYVPQQKEPEVQYVPNQEETEVQYVPQQEDPDVQYVPQQEDPDVQYVPQQEELEVQYIPQQEDPEVQYVPLQEEPAVQQQGEIILPHQAIAAVAAVQEQGEIILPHQAVAAVAAVQEQGEIILPHQAIAAVAAVQELDVEDEDEDDDVEVLQEEVFTYLFTRNQL